MTDNNGFKVAGERMPEFLDGLDLPHEAKRTARVLADAVGDPSVDTFSHRSPSLVAVSCIYVADSAVRPDNHLTQSELTNQTYGTPQALRRIYRDIPAVFFAEDEAADGAYTDRLSESVVQMLRVFRDAEAASLGVSDLEKWFHDPD